MRTIFKNDIDAMTIVKVSIKLTNERMLKFRMNLNLSLKLFMKRRVINILFGNNFDGNIFLTVFLDSSVDYSKFSRANLFLNDKMTNMKGRSDTITSYAHDEFKYYKKSFKQIDILNLNYQEIIP